jgi:hypothetical protein
VLNRNCGEDEGEKCQGADNFLDSEGKFLVEFLKMDATINSERYVQTLKKLEQRIQTVRPNRKMNQVLIVPTVPM